MQKINNLLELNSGLLKSINSYKCISYAYSPKTLLDI